MGVEVNGELNSVLVKIGVIRGTFFWVKYGNCN
jgi:hypothetical protein